MSIFKYSNEELNNNKIIKMNQDESTELLNSSKLKETREKADKAIDESQELLKSLGHSKEVDKLNRQVKGKNEEGRKLDHKPQIKSRDELVREANEHSPNRVEIEDFMSDKEINDAFRKQEKINRGFSEKTNIINPNDLSFLSIAIALMVAKNLITPEIEKHFDYGNTINKETRYNQNDKLINDIHKDNNEQFINEHSKHHDKGYWTKIITQPVPYDAIAGSKNLKYNLAGPNHREQTLGHDPIIGWLFGTLNILTDTISFNDFNSYRVSRKPSLSITRQKVPLPEMVNEGYEMAKTDYMNLPAAIFTEAQHLKSDEYTKVGLPVPLIEVFNENLAGNLYKSNYDALCFSRDVKIVGTSFVVSKLIDIIIILVHSLFKDPNEDERPYEVRTRKILLISNSIASGSSLIRTNITKNPKNLDLGGLLNTVIHLFSDTRFVLKMKEEYVEERISEDLQKQLDELDNLYNRMFKLKDKI